MKRGHRSKLKIELDRRPRIMKLEKLRQENGTSSTSVQQDELYRELRGEADELVQVVSRGAGTWGRSR